MVVAGCVVPRGNEDVSSLCLFFFFFLDRVCIFIRCDDTVLKLGRVRVDFVDLSFVDFLE